MPSESDLAHARAAASDAIARESNDSSTPWSNPESGAGGNITPLLASRIVREIYGAGASWRVTHAALPSPGYRAKLAGVASGKWEVRNLRPLSQG